MNMKNPVLLGLKLAALVAILLAANALAAWVSGVGKFAQTDNPSGTLAGTLAMYALDALVLGYLILRSRWTGWRLVVTVFVVFYGVTTFLTQIETLVFLKYLVNIVPAEMISRLFIQGAITAAIFAPLAVFVLGRMRGDATTPPSSWPWTTSWMGWTWRLLLIAILYVVVYISFGALVFRPLAGEAFQAYYGDLQMPPWILPFQMLRGLIWTALAILIIQAMRGSWRETGLMVALLFSVLMSASLLIPTTIMPQAIRLAHLVEVFTSNFLFGWITVWLLWARPRRFSDPGLSGQGR